MNTMRCLSVDVSMDVNALVHAVSLMVLLLLFLFNWEIKETYSFHDVLAHDHSIHFYFSFYLVLGVFAVVSMNIILDYVSYTGMKHRTSRRDLLLGMRSYLSFALIFPTLAVFLGRWLNPERTAGYYLIASACSASIMAYILFSIVVLSDTKAFTPVSSGVIYANISAFSILYCVNDRLPGSNLIRIALLLTFMVLYFANFIYYLMKIDILKEMYIASCTKEAIILSVAFSPCSWIMGVLYLLSNTESAKDIPGENAEAALNRVLIINLTVLLQSFFLIICPERIARLLVFRMKGTVIHTARKLSNKVQPSVVLLMKTISLLRRPNVINATHAHEFFRNSYHNLVLACERILEDIEELEGDALYELSSKAGFFPTLETVEEEINEVVVDKQEELEILPLSIVDFSQTDHATRMNNEKTTTMPNVDGLGMGRTLPKDVSNEKFQRFDCSEISDLSDEEYYYDCMKYGRNSPSSTDLQMLEEGTEKKYDENKLTFISWIPTGSSIRRNQITPGDDTTQIGAISNDHNDNDNHNHRKNSAISANSIGGSDSKLDEGSSLFNLFF